MSKQKKEKIKCRWCGEVVEQKPSGPKKIYCNPSHKSMYYNKLKEDRLNRMSPEEFIKKELKGEVEMEEQKKNYMDEIVISKVVQPCGNIVFRTNGSLIGNLGLKAQDVIKITIEVVHRG